MACIRVSLNAALQMQRPVLHVLDAANVSTYLANRVNDRCAATSDHEHQASWAGALGRLHPRGAGPVT